MHGLRNIRVIDLSRGIAGAYATKLFADAGADVILVEPPDGHPLRRRGALFDFLAQSKRSVIGAPPDDADLYVVDTPDELDVPSSVVVLSITPYGRKGPWSAGHPSTDFTIQAESGSIAMRGFPGQPPVQMGGNIVDWAGGTFGAPAALAAVRRAGRTGRGDVVDVSLLEVSHLITNLFMDVNDSLSGRPELGPPTRGPELPSIEPTKDGWVGFNTNAAQQFQDFLVLIGRDDLLKDEDFMSPGGRVRRRGEIRDSMLEWTRSHTTDEIVERASLFRIPVAQVGNGKTVLAHEQLVARDFYIDSPDGRFKQPRPPYLIGGARLDLPREAPSIGADSGKIEKRARPKPTGAADPFEGVKVLDATCWWAGPAVTQVWAYLGADVIHMESIQRPDAMRMTLGMLHFNKPQWWEYSSFFLGFNQNKRDLTLNLSDPRGRDLAVKLIEQSDVMVENYSPRVFEQFGLDWAAVHDINPRLVMVRIPAFGLTGPWRERVGFAQTVEQFSGLAYVTGHPDDPPIIPRGPGDPIGGMHGAFALQVALEERDRTGEGMLVEMPLVESALNIAAEQVVQYTATGELLERRGNRSRGFAPQGLYTCGSNDGGLESWVAISIETDEQWAALKQLIGYAEGDLDTFEQREAAHDRIDEVIDAWAADREVRSTVQELLSKGIPAAEVADGRRIHENPQILARGFYEEAVHPVVGTHLFTTFPFRFDSIERWTREPAPALGEHNAEILRELGLTDGEIAALETDAVIGSRPAGM